MGAHLLRLVPNHAIAKLIVSFVLVFLYTNALAVKFAYIPITIQNGVIAVVNTATMEIVANVSVFNPTGVAINSDGSKVYISQRYPEGEEGRIAILNTHTNQIEETHLTGIGLVQPASLVYHPTTNAIFVTHNNGVTKIQLDEQGLPTEETVTSPADYNSGEVDYLGNYIISTGTILNTLSQPVGSGISLSNASTGELINDHSFGNIGTIGITVDRSSSVAYITNRNNDSVYVIGIENDEIVVKDEIQLDEGRAPFGITYNSHHERLYVANTASLGEFEGNAPTGGDNSLDEIDINDNNAIGKNYQLASLEGQYSYGVIPLTANYEPDRDELFVIKSLYGSVGAGTYLSVIPNGITGLQLEREEHLLVHDRGRPQFAGQFLGPDCSQCPEGPDSEDTTTIKRRSSLDSLTIALLVFSLLVARRFGTTTQTTRNSR